MPLYEFECCGKRWEEIRGWEESDSAKAKCQSCQKLVKRIEFSVNALPLAFYGNPDGYARPSQTKRHSYKVVSAKDGNRDSGA